MRAIIAQSTEVEVVREASSEELIATIRTAAAGDRALTPTVAARVASMFHRPHLVQREIQILQYLARGLSNKEIGTELHLSEETIKWHLKSIFTKLDVSDRTKAVIIALQRGIIHL